MQYVHAPSDTIRNIFLVLEGDLSRFEERDNLYLAMIAGLIKINKNPAEMTAFEKAELAHYVKGNEPTIKHDFEKGNPEVKKEIREIYSIIA